VLALAVIHDGGARSEEARLGDVTLQIVREWVLRFKSEGARGLIGRKPPGQPRLLTPEHRQALMAIIESGPTPAIHGVA
jgi:transposase